jgi:hypothetical protein
MSVVDSYTQWDFLKHSFLKPEPVPRRVVVTRVIEDDLSAARVKKGAGRRRKENIGADGERVAREKILEAKRERHEQQRRERLHRLDRRNEFDTITYRRQKAPFHAPIAHVREPKMSAFLEREAYVRLRDSSEGKFFSPAWTGSSHDLRQELAHREGLLKSKSSSELGVGRNDIPSHGVEDQFSQSWYSNNRSRGGIRGLIETTAPGQFTPRKVYKGGARNESEIRMQFELGLPVGMGNGTRRAEGPVYATLPPPKSYALRRDTAR